MKMAARDFVLLLVIAAASATAADDILYKLDEGPRFQYVQAHDKLHLVDLWMKTSDMKEAARYNPNTQNVYHLFTRQNPTVSQPLVIGDNDTLRWGNYRDYRRTIFIMHGWLDGALSRINSVLVPAFLASADVNVFVVDWSAGASTLNYTAAVANTVASGEAVARFINWVGNETYSRAHQYHLVGHGLGGHQAGIVGRNVNGTVAYITGLDPALAGWTNNSHKFRPNDGAYTEVIHTNAGALGYIAPLAHVDFYPNGGINMTGCDGMNCDHERSFHYFGESLSSGGFWGRRCETYTAAMSGNCFLPGSIRMGGITPKTGYTGIYSLETNAGPPFSKDL